MNKIALAFTVAIALAAVSVPVEAMNIGSLSRQRPVIAGTELVTSGIPTICHGCVGGGSKGSDIAPVMHIIFASISGFVLSHLAGNQPITMATAD